MPKRHATGVLLSSDGTGHEATWHDLTWDRALDWLLLVECAPDDQALRARLDQWLAAAETHRAAFARAARLWRLAGDLPPRETRLR